jgi:TolB-like protein/DNA-binding winged helix-turn-helix (wHTH) protein/Flp pilus assembly protein TadD
MPQSCFRFDDFELDIERHELRRSGHHLKLERIPMQLLTFMLENQGKLVRRDAIVERLWGKNVFVEAEHSINTAVNKLRAILRDDSRNPRFIRTVVGQGYCFIAIVEIVSSVPFSAESSSHTLSAAQNSHPESLRIEEQPISISEKNKPLTKSESPLQKKLESEAKKSFNMNLWHVLGIAGALGASLMIALGTHLLYTQKRTPQRSPETVGFHSVAVLPFRNLAQTSDQDYLVDGMTDQLITELAKSSSLRVISRTSVMQFKETQKPMREIARALDVDAIVEGSYLHAEKEVRITAQLLDARNDQHLWAQTYEESDKGLLAMQDQVSNDIARQVSLSLGSNFSNSKSRHTNAKARDAYLRGQYLRNERTLQGLNDSIRYYTEAIRADPEYAEAYAALAEAYVLVSVYGGMRPSDSLFKAQVAAEKALQLDSSLSQSHTALAAIQSDRDWNWRGAESEFLRAIQLNPEDPTAHHWYSQHLSRLGRSQEAEAEIKRALVLDPLSPIVQTDAAETAYWTRNPAKAMKQVDEVLALNPDFAQAHLVKGKIFEELGQYQLAEREFVTVDRLFGGTTNVDSLRAHAMALAGESDAALKIAKNLEENATHNYVSGVQVAQIYCALHRTNDALNWLERAYQRHDTGMNTLKVDPLLDGCRSDPRLDNLLKRLQLDP